MILYFQLLAGTNCEIPIEEALGFVGASLANCRESWKGISTSDPGFGVSGSELHVPTTGDEKTQTRGFLDMEIPRLSVGLGTEFGGGGFIFPQKS